MLALLLSEFGGYIAAALAALVALAGVYFKGRSSGKTEVVAEREAVIHKQADQAKQEVRDVETKIESKPDDAVRDLARSKWVRR